MTTAPRQPRSSPHDQADPVPVTPLLTQSQQVRNNHIVRAQQITNQLIELYAQLAFDRGSELRLRHETFQSVMADPKTNVTTAREQASIAAQHYSVETMKTQGEIDGLLLALQHCDRVINNWTELE